MGRPSGFKQKEETKLKQKENNIGKHNHTKENNPFYGKHHSEETKKKLSDSRKGKGIGKYNHNYGNHKLKGHKLTAGQCEKIRQAKLGKNNPSWIDGMEDDF